MIFEMNVVLAMISLTMAVILLDKYHKEYVLPELDKAKKSKNSLPKKNKNKK